MPNQGEYYQQAFTGQEHGLVKVSQFVASLNAIQTGLNKLPGVRELHEDRVTAVTATGGPVAYTVMMTSPPVAYREGIALQVRFPVANQPDPTLDLLDPNGVALGAKPIRQVDGTSLTEAHIAANARAELYYVEEGAGYWTLGAGARGVRGPAGPPDGTFSLNAMNELVFSPNDGGVDTNLGPVAPLWQGTYAAATTYSFLHLVRSGRKLYLHVGLADTTGTAVTDTTVWQELARDGYDAALAFNFSTSPTMADPAAGDIRLNNATPGSVTRIAVDDEDGDGNDVGAYIASFDDTGEANGHGTLFIRDISNDSLLVYRVDSLVDNTGWTRLNVTHVSGDTLPADDAQLAVWFGPTGNKGEDQTVSAFSALTFAGSLTWNVGTTPNGTLTLTGNVTALTLSGDEDGGVYNLLLKQDSTGGRTFAFPSGWKWTAGTADAIASGANAETLLTIRRIGSDIVAAPLLPDLG